MWPLNFPTPEATVRLGGVAYDAQRQLIYVAQRGADVDGYASRPVIHVFRLNSSPGSIASPAPSTVSSVTLTADKAAPQVSGTAVTFAAQPSGGLAPYQYKWLISDGVTSTVAVNWTASNQMTWTPRAANPKHVVSVWVRSAGNTTDALEASASLAFPIADTPATGAATSVTLVANRVAPQPPLTAITWTATPVGGVAPHEYKWLVSDGTTTTVAAAWSTINSFVWTPSAANANYRVEVWVRSAGNTVDAQQASASSAFPIAAGSTAAPAPPAPAPPASVPTPTPGAAVTAVTLTSSKLSPQPAGTYILFTAQAIGGVGPHQYQWWLFNGQQWVAVSGWITTNTMAWAGQAASPNYQWSVRARSAGSTECRW